MARDVERILRAELETTLDGPPAIGVAVERTRRCTGVAAQGRDRVPQRDKVPIHYAPVGATGVHGLPLPAANRRAASIFSICGRKSK